MTHRPLPPPGYASWLDFAVSTMDTRSVELQAMLSEDATTCSREDMLAAARAELDELRRRAAAATLPGTNA